MTRPWSNWRKSGYASTETGVTAFELFLQVYLLEFYIRQYELNPLIASVAAALAVLWDGITDPIAGYLSDQSKVGIFGKRGTFMIVGAIGLSLSGIALFHPPSDLSQVSLGFWFFISYILVNTSMTLVTVPHIACVGDYVSDSHERNQFFGWRLLFSNIGLLIGIALPSLYAQHDGWLGGRSEAVKWMAFMLLITSGLCLGSLYRVPVIGSYAHSERSIRSLMFSLKSMVRNRFFMVLLLAFSISGIARALNSGFALFYYKDVLQLNEKTEVSIILIVFIFSIILSIPLWIFAGKSYSKEKPALFGVLTLGALTCLTYPFFPQNSIIGPLIMAVIGGVAVGSILLLESLVMDTIDFGESKAQKRDAGIYFGCWKMSSKFARALGIALTGPILVWTDYQTNTLIQSELTLTKIGYVFGMGVGVLFLLAALVLTRMKVKNMMAGRD